MVRKIEDSVMVFTSSDLLISQKLEINVFRKFFVRVIWRSEELLDLLVLD